MEIALITFSLLSLAMSWMLNGPSGSVEGEIGRESERERSNGPRGGWREKRGRGEREREVSILLSKT